MTREEQLREIEEALQAGRSALNAIVEAERHVSGARGFGIWDMLGGGLISGILKHSKMNEAQRCVDFAIHEVERFQKELADVNINLSYGVEFDGMTKALDLVFDNILVDALIQSRIKETKNSLAQTRNQVEAAIRTLEDRKKQMIE